MEEYCENLSEELFAPDELLDRAVLDNDGIDIGNVVGMSQDQENIQRGGC